MIVKIVLIEDDEIDQEKIRRCLGTYESEFVIDAAGSLADGLQLMNTNRYDIVVTDLALPDCCGVETVSRIRDAFADIPILVLSGQQGDRAAFETIQLGAQDFLSKADLTTADLERSIRYAMERQKSLISSRRLNSELALQAEMLQTQHEMLEQKNRKLHSLYETAHKFVDNVSDEFRTPLAVIKDYVSLVREGKVGATNDEQKRMLAIAEGRADDLNDMIDDMLDVSKLESGLLGALRQECQLEKILANVMPDLRRKAEVRRIDFKIELPDELPALYCDAQKVGRVIINLVTNALKTCGDPGEIRVTACFRPDEGEVCVEVSDNGEGIAQQELDVMIGRFKQDETRAGAGTKGLGLGLNIARELVDLNFGQMSASSTPGIGTCINFTVPIADSIKMTQRYLRRIPSLCDEATNVSLVECRLADEATDDAVKELDSFLQRVLTRLEMVFRSGSRSWLLVLPVAGDELTECLNKIQREHRRANRDRVRSELPDFILKVVQTSRVSTCTDKLLSKFKRLMNFSDEEVRPVAEFIANSTNVEQTTLN